MDGHELFRTHLLDYIWQWRMFKGRVEENRDTTIINKYIIAGTDTYYPCQQLTDI